MRTAEEAINDDFRRIIENDPTLRAMFTVRLPSYRYYEIGKDQYFWTTERVKHKGKMRFASGVYKCLNPKDKVRLAFKLTRECYHVKRKDAKARAWKLYQGAKGEPV